ncbi:MAG: YafY family transcriptional regulator [Burkholderiales bacterium]|nr:YafY family transcriptional regulator [Burkholderiales bacterium]
MAKSTSRVLALLELLQSHGLMSGSELARRLDVDPRTLRRYIVALDELGIPLVTERGRDGGYRLMQGFKLPPMMFDNEEAMALALGLVAGRQLGLALAAGASALSKLERVLPATLRDRVHAVGDTVALDIARARSLENSETLATVSTASHQQQRLHIRYVDNVGSRTERDIDPYGLALWEGNWYVVSYCHLRQGMRTFRLDHIEAVRPIPASFGRPADFDPIAYLEEAIARLPRKHAVQVVLHTDLQTAKRYLFTTMGVLEPQDEGVLLKSQADSLEWMARELARLPFGFDIQEPVELKTILAAHARRLLATLGEA